MIFFSIGKCLVFRVTREALSTSAVAAIIASPKPTPWLLKNWRLNKPPIVAIRTSTGITFDRANEQIERRPLNSFSNTSVKFCNSDGGNHGPASKPTHKMHRVRLLPAKVNQNVSVNQQGLRHHLLVGPDISVPRFPEFIKIRQIVAVLPHPLNSGKRLLPVAKLLGLLLPRIAQKALHRFVHQLIVTFTSRARQLFNPGRVLIRQFNLQSGHNECLFRDYMYFSISLQ